MNRHVFLFASIGIFIGVLYGVFATGAAAQGSYRLHVPYVGREDALPPAPPLHQIEGIVTLCHTESGTAQCDIYRMRADGSEVQNLTNTMGQSEHFITASPDGQRILYLVERQYYLMQSDGSNALPVFISEASNYAQHFEWNAQGDLLYLYGAPRITDLALYVLSAGTTTPLLIATDVTNKEEQTRVNWSPDGSRIAFTSDQNVRPANVYHIAADGTDRVRVTMNGGSFQAWLVDGTLLVEQEGKPWIVSLNGTTQTRWTAWDEVDGGIDSLSPDNRHILYFNPLLAPGEPLPADFLALNHRDAFTHVSYQQQGACYNTDPCTLGLSVWSADSRVVAWVLDSVPQDGGSSKIYYARFPFTHPRVVGTSDYDGDPQLIQQWLFYRTYDYTLQRIYLRVLNVESGEWQTIIPPSLDTRIMYTSQWRLVP